MTGTLGRYQLVAEIARGGMGIVYLAHAQGPSKFSKLVVIKELNPELVDDTAFLGMFMDEARLAARLNHPNIVQTNEVGDDDNRHFMVMEYLQGQSLSRSIRRLRKQAKMAPGTYARLLVDVLSALQYAHDLRDFDGTPLGVVHRDVNPQNVFVTFEGQVKVLDFGIAKAGDALHQTRAGIIKGKIVYMAPEQTRGGRVDRRADLFAVGLMLYEAYAGESLWEGKADIEVLEALAGRRIPSFRRPEIPPSLEPILELALAADPAARYATAADMGRDLERYLHAAADTSSARDFGRLVGVEFALERQRTDAILERYIAGHREGLDAASNDAAPFTLRPSATPTSAPGTSRAPAPPTTSPVEISSPSTGSVSPPDTQPASTLASPAHARTRRRSLAGPIGAALLAAVAGLAFALTRASSPVPRSPSGETPPQVASDEVPLTRAQAPLSGPVPEARKDNDNNNKDKETSNERAVSLFVRVTPAAASVSIDGKPAANPMQMDVPPDDSVHELRASAPGYVSRIERMRFDANVRLDLVLTPAQAPRVAATPPRSRERAAAQPTAASPPPPAATDVSSQGGKPPKRKIDPNDPYGGT